MKRKLVCLFMILSLVVLSMAGCTKKDGGSDAKPTSEAGASNGSTEKDPASDPAGTTAEPAAATATPTPVPATPTPVPATPTPTEIPKPEGKTYEDGYKSAVAGDSGNFDAEALRAEGFTVVASPQEFIEAVRPGAKIVFAPGRYNLSEFTEDYWQNNFSEENREDFRISINEWVGLIDRFDGAELVITGVDDLLISGGSENPEETELVIDPRYAAVLRFDKCNDVKIANLKIGHVEQADCEGNVIDLSGCGGARFYNTDIYGCGVYGISAFDGSSDIYVYDSVIHDCSYGAVEYRWGMGPFVCINSKLIDTAGIAYETTAYSSLVFDRCTLGDWEITAVGFRDDIELKDCTLGEVQYLPEFEEEREDAPEWLKGSFDPSTFDFDSMEYAYDDEYLTQSIYYNDYSYWQGYKRIDRRTGETMLLPYYDMKDGIRRDVRCGFKFASEDDYEYDPDAKSKFWLSIDDEYYEGTWFYSSAHSAVLQFEEEGFDGINESDVYEPWYGKHINVTVYRDLDTEGSHPWLMMELDDITVWLY